MKTFPFFSPLAHWQAYGAARDTNMTKDEAKWVAYKLYRHARDHFDRQQPKEKRILEYLLTIRDPLERRWVIA